MIIHLDDIKYIIHLKTSISAIQIKRIYNEEIHLFVPADYSEEHLISYLKQKIFKSDLQNFKNQPINETYLEVFNTKYILKQSTSSYSYISGNQIITNKNIRLKLTRDKIKQELLLQFINQQISDWEERLQTILPPVVLKNIPKKYYKINEENVYFHKNLYDYGFDYISYIISCAIFDLLKIEQENKELLWNKFIRDWKQSEKIKIYEQSNPYQQ